MTADRVQRCLVVSDWWLVETTRASTERFDRPERFGRELTVERLTAEGLGRTSH
jgi:hypothetical protein